MIQPGLIPLQPNLDFMDTFEPFQGEDGGSAHGCPVASALDKDVPLSRGELSDGKAAGGGLGIFPELLSCLVVATRSGKGVWAAVLSQGNRYSRCLRASGLAATASRSPSRQQRALSTQPPPRSFLRLALALALPPCRAGAVPARPRAAHAGCRRVWLASEGLFLQSSLGGGGCPLAWRSSGSGGAQCLTRVHVGSRK